ncbi:hypothetical protein [Bartonella grahamii]|uniref:hypothetical protein n=1 Tax=Bartonella grahamii TaxID=33045 RepID=UPI002E7AB4E3|nr:hypothetical protein [Bartonella grahamii]
MEWCERMWGDAFVNGAGKARMERGKCLGVGRGVGNGGGESAYGIKGRGGIRGGVVRRDA